MAGFWDYLRMSMGWWSVPASTEPTVHIAIRSAASQCYQPGAVKSAVYQSGSVATSLVQ